MTERFHALDRLRAAAVVSMIQGHVFTALLAKDALTPTVRQLHSFVHGLTAPAFLVGAGLAFGLATYPRYDAHRRGGALLRARLRRCAMLLAIGYALQLPGGSLAAALSMRGEALGPVLRVGPLHLIALCLAGCQLAILGVRSPRAHALGALAGGVAILAASPHVYAHHRASGLGVFFAPWVDDATGSLFPIFPWASYLLLGVSGGGLLVLAPDVGRRARTWAVFGVVLSCAGFACFRAGLSSSPPSWYWYASPPNVALRLGLVALLLSVLQWTRSRRETGSGSGELARHSLLAYVVHLLLLYGTPLTPNLARRYGGQLALGQASAAFAGILLVTLLCVRASPWSSAVLARTSGRVQLALTVIGLLVLMR